MHTVNCHLFSFKNPNFGKLEDQMKKSVFMVLAVILVLIAPWSRSLLGNQDLEKAFENGDTVKILQLFADNPQLLKADMGEGMTPLHYGVYYGYIQIVDYALKNGIDLNIKDRRPSCWPAVLRKTPGTRTAIRLSPMR